MKLKHCHVNNYNNLTKENSMQWLYILLSIFLFHHNAFSGETASNFRETIKKYGYTDKDSDHSYIESYEELLRPFTDKPCNLLELGVNFGGSAIMWYEYLPQSTLFLLDNRNVMMPHITSAMDPERWHLYVDDAYTPEVVALMEQECPNGFDIIIDDGPHNFESQRFVVTSYLPLLNKGGVLIIEDIQHFDIVDILQEYVPDSSEFQIEIIDLREIKDRYDDVLFVIKRLDS